MSQPIIEYTEFDLLYLKLQFLKNKQLTPWTKPNIL